MFLLATPGVDSSSWWTPVVGASGAVFGVWGAIMVIHRRLRRDNGGLVALLLINAVIGFVPGLSIAWQAHLGGVVTGALAAAVLAYTPPRSGGSGTRSAWPASPSCCSSSSPSRPPPCPLA